MFELIEAVDLALMHSLRAWHAPWLDTLMAFISASGGAGLIWLTLAVVALFSPRDRAAAWRVLLTVALCYVMVDAVLKPLIGRARPELTVTVQATAPPRSLPPQPESHAFPSGHSTSTFGAAVAVSRMWPSGRVIWWTFAVLVGYSRIYLGHHYPFDVLAGALLGIALAFWVLGGRHRATYASTLPHLLPPGTIVRP